jgi:hypothetical protein
MTFEMGCISFISAESWVFITDAERAAVKAHL